MNEGGEAASNTHGTPLKQRRSCLQLVWLLLAARDQPRASIHRRCSTVQLSRRVLSKRSSDPGFSPWIRRARGFRNGTVRPSHRPSFLLRYLCIRERCTLTILVVLEEEEQEDNNPRRINIRRGRSSI